MEAASRAPSVSGRSLRLELAPSAKLAGLIVTLHLAAALSMASVMPRATGYLLAGALLALGMAAAWSRALLRSAGSVRAMELDGDSVVLEPRSGERWAAQVGPRRYVGRFVVTLPVTHPVRRTLLVTSDMLGPDSFRRLRMWALWGKVPRVAPKQLAG